MNKSCLSVTGACLVLLLGMFSLSFLTTFNSKALAAEGEEWQALPVENGGFEEKPASSSDLPSWDYWTGGYKTGMSISDEEVYEGQRSLKVENDGVVGLFSQAISVKEGKTYQFSGKIYIENLISGNPGVWLRWLDSNGKIIENNAKYFEDLPLQEWQDLSITGTAPTGATGVKIFIYQTSTSKMLGYYDELQLFEKTDGKQLEMPYEFGDAINLGPAALAAKTQGAAIGEGELYYATNGSPATFFAADEKTGEMIFSQELPGNDVIWGMTVGSDGNVYFSGTYNGILYRYVTDEKRLEEVGKNPSDNWVWELEATDDGKIYGATYPNAKAFEYDIESDTFTDLGSFHDEQKYARGLGVTEDHLYVGIGTTTYLYQMDRKTGEKQEIELPITGGSSSVSNVWEYGDRLFIAYGTSLLILDVNTHETLKQITWRDKHAFDGLISSPSPYDENLIYFLSKNARELWTYNLETNEIEKVETDIEQFPASPAKAIEWIKNEDGTDVLAILHHQIEYSVYNPKTNEVKVGYPEVEMQGLSIQSLEIGPEDDVYLSGYQGSIGVYDTSAEDYILHERDPHQIEGMGFLNGNVYMGAYGGARIYKYDPSNPYEYTDGKSGNNPEMVYDIQDGQSRPFTFASGDNKLFVGTISDYGQLGGSLTIYDEDLDEWKSIRNIVENQSIIGLAYQDGVVYGGSTIAGGLGIDPTEEKAKMFEYNVTSEEYQVFDLEVDGLEKPEMIGELSVGPDGNLWGVAWGFDETGLENSVIFAMDMQSKEIIKSKELYSGVHRGSQWRPFYIRWDNQGLLYTTAGRKLTVIDPETLASKQLISGTVNLMDLDNEGNIYYASGADLYKMPVPLEEATISLEDTTLTQGEEESLNLDVTLANGNAADINGAEIEWANTSPEVAEIVDGKLIAKNAGTTKIKATVSYNGETLESNEITVVVEVTTHSLKAQLTDLKESDSIDHSTYKKLVNRLNQSDHHYKKGHTDQAIKHLQDFLKHLEKSQVEAGIKETLERNVNALKDSWQS
ncbi:FIMAH domain-containing protein [Guptibacillus sedimenti]|uniref:FIMAH domain-containing protein n=1 Tax=Guptibacillus sedimenti TaxID=3025680 RepID=UPI0023620394|nr:carbohydrate binding domain-containing protein [Pseudalkalibacillus sedimenti]